MEISTLIINSLKTIIGVIYPPLKKKFFDQPKIYIRVTGIGRTFRPEFLDIDLYKNPENMLNRLQIVYSTWQRQLNFLNHSEHAAYNIKLATQVDKEYFTIEPDIDSFKPLLTNSDISYSLKVSDTFQRREREARSEYPEPKHITELKLTLEYTNVKGTKFYTEFDNSLDEQHKNKFFKKIPNKGNLIF